MLPLPHHTPRSPWFGIFPLDSSSRLLWRHQSPLPPRFFWCDPPPDTPSPLFSPGKLGGMKNSQIFPGRHLNVFFSVLLASLPHVLLFPSSSGCVCSFLDQRGEMGSTELACPIPFLPSCSPSGSKAAILQPFPPFPRRCAKGRRSKPHPFFSISSFPFNFVVFWRMGSLRGGCVCVRGVGFFGGGCLGC